MANKTQVARARMKDFSYVEALARKFEFAVGFLPREAIRERLARDEVLLARENDEPAGYLLGARCLGNAKHVRPIFQACVQMDAQRRHHGLALLDQLTKEARLAGQAMIQCFCRQNLEANEFWRAAGFVPVALRDVGAVRGHPCILWRKPLVIMTPETLSFVPPNPNHQTGGGRSVRRFDFEKLPCISPYSQQDLKLELEKIGLAA
jgi:N-acetylglutamate synthase-like GNAT family acetyltransferase